MSREWELWALRVHAIPFQRPSGAQGDREQLLSVENLYDDPKGTTMRSKGHKRQWKLQCLWVKMVNHRAAKVWFAEAAVGYSKSVVPQEHKPGQEPTPCCLGNEPGLGRELTAPIHPYLGDVICDQKHPWAQACNSDCKSNKPKIAPEGYCLGSGCFSWEETYTNTRGGKASMQDTNFILIALDQHIFDTPNWASVHPAYLHSK